MDVVADTEPMDTRGVGEEGVKLPFGKSAEVAVSSFDGMVRADLAVTEEEVFNK